MGTDLIEGWLSSRLFDVETAALVALVTGLVIKLAGYVSTLIGTVSGMYYAVRGTYRKYMGWKLKRAERHLKAQTELFQKLMAAEVAKLAPALAPVTGPVPPAAYGGSQGPAQALDSEAPHWTARPCARKDV